MSKDSYQILWFIFWLLVAWPIAFIYLMWWIIPSRDSNLPTTDAPDLKSKEEVFTKKKTKSTKDVNRNKTIFRPEFSN